MVVSSICVRAVIASYADPVPKSVPSEPNLARPQFSSGNENRPASDHVMISGRADRKSFEIGIQLSQYRNAREREDG
jgi:hypothetical protein